MVSPKFQPVRNAVTLASRSVGFAANRVVRNSIVGSVGRPYIHDSSPSANMFLARAESLRVSPNSLTASTVSDGQVDVVHGERLERAVLERVLGRSPPW